ncbi:hypothetical protein SPRG_16006 [Saprolegnia parasitica CBS 223.65]|uniref:F-box domain-containing protein n=1 Tax=Saprolegnia parasitica (strain CBS 223.65) TaxID=695850 RepID=A0A067BWC5_SAPPC|nr:hypothetical protein SPRG_16006 [Saprolegnia parasitica CBS 223.65]KDO18586.1 hypothetical protein SPRG_16006 [Saprolegnia parasitica CBS 223.65]|eukprot:XP_012210699.1 hypothetical protein SPRG_16006 [Saprolegnia parasitica CBS 223.65]
MATKRPHHDASTAVARLHGAVLINMLQMIPTARDALAFLNAWPSTALPPSLVALKELSGVMSFTTQWPSIVLQAIPTDHVEIAVSALPAFPQIQASDKADPRCLVAALPRTVHVKLSTSGTWTDATHAVVRAWHDHITELSFHETSDVPDAVVDALRQCKHLRTVSILNPMNATATQQIVAAVTTRSLQQLHLDIKFKDPLDTTTMAAWLRRGGATTLRLACTDVTGATALADAIYSCDSLASLSLVGARGVVNALLASPRPLHQLSELALDVRGAAHNDTALLHKLSGAKMTSLTLIGRIIDAPPGIWKPLMSFTKLQQLTLQRISLLDVSASGTCPQLRRVTLSELAMQTNDIPMLAKWLGTSNSLQKLEWSDMKLGRKGLTALAQALPHWMTLGLEMLSLRDIPIDADGARQIAASLKLARNPTPVRIALSNSQLVRGSVQQLAAAIDVCQQVTLGLFSSHSRKFKLEMAAALGQTDVDAGDVIFAQLASPPA